MHDVSRADHLQWCKDRALEYLKPGPSYNLSDAVASMGSDLKKHPETAGMDSLVMIGMFEVMQGNEAGVRRFIEGFN